VPHTNSNDGARPQGRFAPIGHLTGRGPHNQQWLVEGLLPLGAVEVGWNEGDPIDFNLDLLDLGLKAAYPVDERPLWCDRRVTKHGAAVLLYGDGRARKGFSGRLIVLDPKRPKHIVSGTNHKLFEDDAYGRYHLSEAGVELERVLLAIEDLRLIAVNLLWPFLPDDFGAGPSLPVWDWLRKLSAETGAAVLAMVDGPEQLERMWRKGIRLAAECRPPQEGAK
jgi:hypothetical protein